MNLTKTFAFEPNQNVRIKTHVLDTDGIVKNIQIDQTESVDYWVKFKDGDGTFSGAWFQESELSG